MTLTELDPPVETSRARRLKAATHTTHERLDKSIMAGRPFESRERYGWFVAVQHGFHRDIDALYSNTVLDRLLADLAGRRRLGLIEQDLADLGVAAPALDATPTFRTDVDIPTSTRLALCGGRLQPWRRVPAEGSNTARPVGKLRCTAPGCGSGRARSALEDLHRCT